MDRVSYAQRLVGGRVGGKYDVSRVLGIGGMGAVYEARHAYTGRRVAVKVMGPDFASSQDAVDRFLQEAQAPSSIGHPNIVEVLDAGEDPELGLYVVLEYLEGEDLEASVERGTVDARTLLGVTAQLLDALGAAHARGFVHRDIKPANIFITRDHDGRTKVKLLDFGIARNVARGLTVGKTVMGTPHYMSPEQAEGHPVDGRADLWAVGAVLFHALAGVPPYDGDNPNVIMVSIILGDVPSLKKLRPDLSRALLDVVDRALTKDLDARWQTARQMADALATAPEMHGGVLKISSTMRNRSGALSVTRPAPPSIDPPRASTGTLGPEDSAPPIASTRETTTPAPNRTVQYAAASLTVVAALVAGVAIVVSSRSSPPPVVRTPAPRARLALPPPAATPPAPIVAAPAPPVVVAVVDAAVVAPERERHREHVRRPRPPPTVAASPEPQPAPAPATQRIGGLNIGSYNAP